MKETCGAEPPSDIILGWAEDGGDGEEVIDDQRGAGSEEENEEAGTVVVMDCKGKVNDEVCDGAPDPVTGAEVDPDEGVEVKKARAIIDSISKSFMSSFSGLAAAKADLGWLEEVKCAEGALEAISFGLEGVTSIAVGIVAID